MACKGYLKPLLFLAGAAFVLPTHGERGHAATQLSAPARPATPAAPAAAGVADLTGALDLSELDSGIGACQDLNSFVNAKWVAANPIPSDSTSWGAFDQLVERNLIAQHDIVANAARNAPLAAPGSIERKIGWLYQAGMDQDAIDRAGFDPIKPKLDAIAALESSADVAKYIYTSFSDGAQPVFNFGSGADLEDARMQIGFADQGGLGLPTTSFYTDAKHAGIRKAYVDYIARSLRLTGIPMGDAEIQAADVLDFETELASASLSPPELRDLDNRYHLVTVEQANEITPHFSWSRFFAAQGIAIDDRFSLSQPKFFAEFDRLLAHAPISQWKAYLRFHAIDDASPYLSTVFQDNRFEFYGKTLSGQLEQAERWKQVLDAVNESMGEALGQLYVAKEFTPGDKERTEELAASILDALKNRIENAEWMSDATKRKAIEKWGKLLPKIGYPDRWRDWDGLQIGQGDYYGNVMAAARFNYHHDIGHIGKPTDRAEWNMTPQTVNAYYSRSTNTINFPAAFLQPPFFYRNGDDTVNYGGIGAMIGHEATHGFDDLGRQFDGDGNRADWWTAEDEARFGTRAAQLVAQFDGYAPIKGKPGLHVNGQLTLGENIADLGGLNVAYDALQNALKNAPAETQKQVDGYTEDQRFFLSWARVWRNSTREESAELLLNADRHAPTSLRAIGAPSNMLAFAEAFHCRPADPMVRPADKRVKIW